jgi:SAM-dependent methyltransferase
MKICPQCSNEISDSGWLCPACHWNAQFAGAIPILGTRPPEEGEGFSASYFEELASLEAGNFWFRARNELLLWSAEQFLGNARSFLEVGCGTGFVLQALHKRFPDLGLTGSELFIEGLGFAAKRLPGVNLIQMDALNIPFRGHFDAIGAFDVIEHIADDRRALQEFHKALAPGGRLFLTVPQHPWLWSVNDEHAHHQRRYARQELCSKVRDAGFAIRRTTSFVSLLLPLMAMSRRKRDMQAQFDPLEEFRIAPWKQRILERIMHAERLSIRIGLRFPMGGSLLLVAERS